MSAFGGVIRGGGGAELSERKEESPDQVEKEWGINVELLDDMDKKLLKSLLNEGWRKEKRGLRRSGENQSCDVEDKRRVRSPLHEAETRGGRNRGTVEEPGRQTGRFDRSMRVLAWLDADCGTRLARHYEQAGGWRSLPQRQQRHPRTHQKQHSERQPLTSGSNSLVRGSPVLQKDSEEESTTSEEEKRILEESDEFFNDEDADDDDLVLALRKWQEEQLLQQEHYEDLSMQDYVTSSEDDIIEDSDSEDELVLALKTWQEEQKRQQKLQQQHHQQLHHRQLSLAQQPPALTPVIEEKVLSPSYDAFGYFYKDENHVVCHYNKQQIRNHQHQQQTGVTPYWWGDISSVREGPSSPPVLIKHSQTDKSSNVLETPREGNKATKPSRARGVYGRANTCIVTDSGNNGRYKSTVTNLGLLLPTTTSSTSVTTTSSTASSSQSLIPTLHSPLLLLPPLSSSLQITSASTPKLESPGWNFSNRAKPLKSPTNIVSGSFDSKFLGNSLIKSPANVGGIILSPDSNVKTPNNSYSFSNSGSIKTSGGGLGVHSNWCAFSSSSTDKNNSTSLSRKEKEFDNNIDEPLQDISSQHTVVSASPSAASDSGIEKGLGSPAPKSASIDKIGGFFRKFQHKLSTSPGSTSKSPKATSQQKTQDKTSRRLSLSTPSIPSSSVLKPSPVLKVASDHSRCLATRSDPLASGTVPKRQPGSWWGGQQTRSAALSQERAPSGASITPTAPLVKNLSLDYSVSAVAADGAISCSNAGSVGGSGGLSPCVPPDSGPATSVIGAQGDRKGALNIDAHGASCVSEDRKSGVPLTSAGCTGNSIGKGVVVGGKDTQPFVVPQSYQYSHYQQNHQLRHPNLVSKLSTDIKGKNVGPDPHDILVTGSDCQSVCRLPLRDNSEKTPIEVLDKPSADTTNVSTVKPNRGKPTSTWGIPQIWRKSPVSEIEHKIHSDSFERDPQGKIRTLFNNSRGISLSGQNCSGWVNNSFGDVDEECSNTDVKSLKGTQRKEAFSKEDFVNSRSYERSLSSSSDERGTLTVPSAGLDRNRRGSHGTCNHLFLDKASGRKSPLPTKGRKSPSPLPIPPTLSNEVVNATSSSSSSAESSSKPHPQFVGRVFSLSTPRSSPPSQQQSIKTPTKPTLSLQQNGSDLSTSKQISTESPPANYRGRRKFSDTGLTPVPRRLFSDGRRGSLTDEKTLVFAKSKLEKLRNQDRKSSDASSVAALVKQIHNLWGDGDDTEEDNDKSDVTSGLTSSLDDQALVDKRRKKIPISVHQDKEGTKDGFSVRGSKINKLSGTFHVSIDSYISRGEGGAVSAEGKGKNDRGAFLPLAPLSSSSSSNLVYQNSLSTGSGQSQSSGKAVKETVKEVPSNDLTAADNNISASLPAGGVGGSCGTLLSGSEFVGPVAQVASRQLVAAAVSSAACFVGIDTTDSLVTRGASGPNIPTCNGKTNKKTATVQFQPIASWDDYTVRETVSPAVKSVLKQGTRRHSSFAGFSESNDNLVVLQTRSPETTPSVLNNQSKNGLPKSRTSDNYRSILKPTEKPVLTHTDSSSSAPGDKRRAKSPSPKSKKGFDYSPEPKDTELSLSLCLKATRSISPKAKRYRRDTRDNQESTDQSSQATPFSSTDREQYTDSGNCSLDLPTKTIGIQATPRTIGKTSNTGTQTSDLSGGGDSSTDNSSSSSEGGGWLQRLAAKCMASVGGSNRTGPVTGASGNLPRAASVRAEWLLGNKRMGSNPSSPVAQGADASEKFWVPREVVARKRAQSLVPTLSKQESEDDLSSEAATPASIPHPRDLAFNFASEKAGTSGGSSDGQPSTPPSGYNPGRRRASMHDAIDLTKIDTRLYDKKLVRQASVTSIEEESQGTVHISLEHNSETGILTVNLIRAHNLLPRDLTCTANPYCKMTILPGQRTSAQSRIHRKTLNPEFEEEFIFELPAEEVTTSTLEVSFYEYDQFSRDECVGYVRIPLSGMDLSKQVDLWRAIAPYDKPKDQRDLGDVMFSLSYLPSAERLTVVIVRARNLRLMDDGKGDLNPFIKVCITSGSKKLKKKKTSTAHSTNSPIWNEALVFSVHRETLKSIGLEVSAYHDNKLGIDECIGRIKLPANSPDGILCQELLKEKSMPARWYNLS